MIIKFCYFTYNMSFHSCVSPDTYIALLSPASRSGSLHISQEMLSFTGAQQALSRELLDDILFHVEDTTSRLLLHNFLQ